MNEPSRDRVIVYIDAFNLYHGMKEANLRRALWLNVNAMATRFLEDGQDLVWTKYFSARIIGHNDAAIDRQKRQNTYFRALNTLPRYTMYPGKYITKPMFCPYCKDDMGARTHVRCHACHTPQEYRNEKMTDVNIATEMLVDAFQDKYDTAILVSGDSDLSRPVEVISDQFPSKRVWVAFPPKRFSRDLAQRADRQLAIFRKVLLDSQFPDPVIEEKHGDKLWRPATWA
jgi:uncharacterized LabA/DUF88 family protein